MFRTYKIVVLSIFLITSMNISKADDIVLGADTWPPYIQSAGGKTDGYMVEIAKKVFAEKGHTVTYRELPWTRAINEARTGNINGIIGTLISESEDFVFPSESLGLLVDYLFVRKDSTWVYKDINSLKGVKLGLIQDYDYGENISNFLKDNKGSKLVQYVKGKDPLVKNMKKLKAKRIDAILEVKAVFNFVAKEEGFTGLFKSAGSDGMADPVYIAFSPANPKSKLYAEILSDGIAAMRQSGELATILAKYGQKDWK